MMGDGLMIVHVKADPNEHCGAVYTIEVIGPDGKELFKEQCLNEEACTRKIFAFRHAWNMANVPHNLGTIDYGVLDLIENAKKAADLEGVDVKPKSRFTPRKLTVLVYAVKDDTQPDGVKYDIIIHGGVIEPGGCGLVPAELCERTLFAYRYAWNLVGVEHNLGHDLQTVVQMMAEAKQNAKSV